MSEAYNYSKHRPRMGAKVSARDGWKIQKIYGRYPDLDYVKIFTPIGECVDTALTFAAARKRVAFYKQKYALPPSRKLIETIK